ncbi:cytochrome P450 [Lasiosphaeris hirsuta]|uniref:Cytochrome P450 n=1 Tax=Lasiosphaeris hirsuta TaxID=260670 RepID=A0AA40A173_9PEZI|nr:cytochrome P450 [Lasiosphaeris hirsuta]
MLQLSWNWDWGLSWAGDGSGTAADWGTAALTAIAVVGGVYLLLYRMQTARKHPDEPPIIASAVPYVGHLLGMAMQGGRYVKGIGLRNRDKPIFTLPVPGSRIYIVTDPSLAAAVQRASKTLSFTPLVPDIITRILGLDADTVAIVRRHLDPEPGAPRGVLADMHDMVYAYLGPGDALNDLSLAAARELARQVNAFTAASSLPETVDLLVWVRHFVTLGTAAFLYGEQNPLAARPELGLEDAFWDFDHGLGRLLMGVLPSLTARAPYRGREALAAALADYLADVDLDTAVSPIIQKRVAIMRAHGMSPAAAARCEVSFLFAGIVNTATTTFWVVLQIFARSELLACVRAELAGAVVDSEDGKRLQLDLDAVKTRCPTLLSVFRECLRVGSDNYSTRLVKTDTVLAGRHFLRAGSVVQVAGGVMHADPAIWGPDADDFDPERFVKLQGSSSSSSSASTTAGSGTDGGKPQQQQQHHQVHPAAFRAFGGGKTLCPGRHFATNEILAFVAMIVLGFDLDAADGGGEIAVPGKEDGVLPVHILEPKTAVNVRILVRDGREIVVV